MHSGMMKGDPFPLHMLYRKILGWRTPDPACKNTVSLTQRMKCILVLLSAVWRQLWIAVSLTLSVHVCLQTDPYQPTALRWMRLDCQWELPGSVFLAYCLLLNRRKQSRVLAAPSGFNWACDDHILLFSVLFFTLYRIQVDGWNAALFIFTVCGGDPQFRVSVNRTFGTGRELLMNLK